MGREAARGRARPGPQPGRGDEDEDVVAALRSAAKSGAKAGIADLARAVLPRLPRLNAADASAAAWASAKVGDRSSSKTIFKQQSNTCT